MSCLLPSKASLATSFNVEKSIPYQGIPRISIPEAGVEMISFMITPVHTLSYNTLPDGYPNQSFDSAVDLRAIVGEIMSAARGRLPETPEILEDQEAFMALSAKLIADLIDNEPDTGRLPDVKVRFR